MAITRQIIFLAKRDCIEELKALLKSTIKDTKEEDKKEIKTPAEIKKIIEQNRFGGFYKTKKRFIN